jgi:hypothetical protein
MTQLSLTVSSKSPSDFQTLAWIRADSKSEKRLSAAFAAQAFVHAVGHKVKLLTQTEFANQIGVALGVFALEISQQALTLRNHAQQAAATVVIFGVRFKMGGKVVDTCGEQSYLHFWATCVSGATSVFLDNFCLVDGHDVSL